MIIVDKNEEEKKLATIPGHNYLDTVVVKRREGGKAVSL
jgi:hypothetical protein